MENSLKGLILAAGTIITCVVISLGFFISREAKNTASNGANQINQLNLEFSESDKIMYDGAKISGSEVLSVIKKFENEKIAVMVKTNKTTTTYGYTINLTNGELGGISGNKISEAYNEAGNEYINPYASFRGSIVRDNNDVLTAIVFEQ